MRSARGISLTTWRRWPPPRPRSSRDHLDGLHSEIRKRRREQGRGKQDYESPRPVDLASGSAERSSRNREIVFPGRRIEERRIANRDRQNLRGNRQAEGDREDPRRSVAFPVRET